MNIRENIKKSFSFFILTISHNNAFTVNRCNLPYVYILFTKANAASEWSLAFKTVIYAVLSGELIRNKGHYARRC